MQHSFYKNLKSTLGAVAVVMALTACNASKDVVYIQNALPGDVENVVSVNPIKVEVGDEIMVFVSCDDLETSRRLSLVSGSRRPEFTSSGVNTSSNNNSVTLPYLVNDNGDIDMPIIGPVHVAGLTRQQIAEKVAARVVNAKLAKEGTVNVTVQFANLTFAAMGELAKTGTYNIDDDDITLLEAIAMAGDLTIHGKRDAVWVIREQPDGSRKFMKVDLRDSSFMHSPAYFVQQNDVIYVEPNSVRAGQSTINENTFKSVGFWTSLVSVAVSVTTLIVTLTRK